MAMMAPASPWEGAQRINRFVELAVEPIIKIGHGSGRSVRSHAVAFLGHVPPDLGLIGGATSRKGERLRNLSDLALP